MGIDIDIQKGLFDVLLNASIVDDDLNLIEKSFPNVDFSGEKPYLVINVLPATTNSAGLNIDIYEGILQVSIVFSLGVGDFTVLRVAEQIKALFPRNTIITEGSTRIYLEKTGTINPAVITGDSYQRPISIPYKSLD